MDKLDEIAYIKVKARPQQVFWSLNGYYQAPSTIVHPSDVTVVRKRDTVWIQESGLPAHLPANRHYNENIADVDTVVQDEGGNWTWASSPDPSCRQPNMWKCAMCAQHRFMDCSCGVETMCGAYVTRMLTVAESPCVHLEPDPSFVCKACQPARRPWGAAPSFSVQSPGQTSKA